MARQPPGQELGDPCAKLEGEDRERFQEGKNPSLALLPGSTKADETQTQVAQVSGWLRWLRSAGEGGLRELPGRLHVGWRGGGEADEGISEAIRSPGLRTEARSSTSRAVPLVCDHKVTDD